MKLRKSSPDYEASNAVVESNDITKPRKIVLTNSHHGSESLADGDVEVRIRHQYPRSKNDISRPPAGSSIRASIVSIRAREIHHSKGKNKQSRDHITAKDDIEIRILKCIRRRRP